MRCSIDSYVDNRTRGESACALDARRQRRLRFHDRPQFPRGFQCASRNIGLKADARDLALFASEVDASAAAVFTRNQFPGAPEGANLFRE